MAIRKVKIIHNITQEKGENVKFDQYYSLHGK